MRCRYYILTGVIAYFVFVITSLQASTVISMFEYRLPIKILNVSGTLWNGQAGTIDTRRNLILKNVQWSFLSSRLLLASAAIDVSAKLNNKPINTRLSAGISGKITVEDLALALDAADIQPLIALPIGELAGEFQVDIDKASFKQGEVPRIDGTINWNRAAVTVAETAELGNVSILVNENDASPLAARISNKGGDISLNGNFTTSEQGDYSLQLTMKPNNTASDNLVKTLAMFSRQQRNGEFVLNNKGNLSQLGLM